MRHPVLQNSTEPCSCCGRDWMSLRAGKVTGSSIAKVMAWHDKPLKTGPKWGDPAKNLAIEIAVVEMGGQPTENNYTNAHMDRGHEQEPIARGLYEAETFSEVTNGGFYEDGRTGCSPDGLVCSDGVVEIKSVVSHIHYACVERGSYDPAYRWQLLHNLRLSQRKWIDFVSFCATFPQGKKLFIHRLYAKDLKQEFKAIDDRLTDFFALVDEIKERL
jgi:hypothetical protein